MAVLPANKNYRSNLWQILAKSENSFGRENNLVRNHGHLIGLTESWAFPDPEYEYFFYRYVRPTNFMPADSVSGLATTASGTTPGGVLAGGTYAGSVGTPSVRNWVGAYDILRRFTGSIPDVRMLSGHILPFIFGAASNEAATVINGINYFQHFILERNELPSFTLEGVLFNTTGVTTDYLVRRARGCKINRATISAEEGQQVRVSLDEILAKGVRHNVAAIATPTTEQEYLGYHANEVWGATQQPLDILMGAAGGGRSLNNMDVYKFSEGQITLLRPNSTNQPDAPSSTDDLTQNPGLVTTLAKIRSFRLTINNNCTAKYWINDLNRFSLANTTATVDELIDDNRNQSLLGTPNPTFIIEGNREYELEIIAAVSDTYLYQQLLSEGKFGREKRGFGIRLRFFRQLLGSSANSFGSVGQENDFMEIRMPADTSGITNLKWGSTFNYGTSGPIIGMSSTNPYPGCFFVTAPYPVPASETEPLIYCTARIAVPSVEILVQDLHKDYLASGPITS